MKVYKNVFLKNWISLVSILIGLGMLIYLLYIFDISVIIESFRKISVWQFASIFVLKLIFSTLGALRWKIILNFYKRNASLWKLYWFRHAIFAVSYFIPPATALGEQAIGAVLLKNEKVPFKIGLLSILLDSLIVALISFLITLFVILTFLLNLAYDLNFSSSILISLITILIFGVVFFSFTRKIISSLHIFLKYLHVSKKLLTKIKKFTYLINDFLSYDKKAFIQVILLTLASYVFILIELFLIVYFLGKVFSPSQLALVEAGNVIASLVPISQALGIAELVASYTVSLLGFVAPFGITLILILRVRHTLLALIGIGVLMFYGVIKLRKKSNE